MRDCEGKSPYNSDFWCSLMTYPIKNRKDEHIYISMEKDIESTTSTWLECVKLIHKALPEINLSDIDISTFFLGKKLHAPIMIGAMTGGTALGKKINRNLALAAQENNIAMMVGSQRVALEHPETIDTFSVTRKNAPDIILIANIGAPQISRLKNLRRLDTLVSMIEADALAIHLNPLQEAVQPEGETDYAGVLEKITELKEYLKIPIVVKETGAGISKEITKLLIKAGVDIIDVSGAGGTSWAAVEYYRAKSRGNNLRENIGKVFWNWGIPTAASIIEVRSEGRDQIRIVGSGGIRTGLDITKAIVIGADLGGLAKPFLKPAVRGKEFVNELIRQIINEIKVSMFLTGSKTLDELRRADFIIFPPLKTWLESRNIKFPWWFY